MHMLTKPRAAGEHGGLAAQGLSNATVAAAQLGDSAPRGRAGAVSDYGWLRRGRSNFLVPSTSGAGLAVDTLEKLSAFFAPGLDRTH